jgi:predicted ATPase/DNA-binding SARP family transcriptional activator
MRAEVHGMPLALATFIGREREIAAVRQILARSRLTTLTGAGGSGKTRLALEVATLETGADASRGAWVELAPIRDPDLVATAILAALGARDESETPAVARIAGLLRNREFLLVLDNCEHLVDACAALADALLRSCPSLRILATSREALGVSGESAWLVPPLSLPTADDASADASEAVQLFVQRARGVLPGFAITPANRRAIVQICRRLDGLPLALELAAARLRVLSPEQIAARLDGRFTLLTTGNRGAMPRHQTLRAAIDWSYDLLGDQERLLLERLSVFGGTFTLEAIEGVCSGGAIAVEDVLDLTSDLVEKSLLEMVDAADSARYRLLETVREYALERLAARGEVEARRREHAAYFAAFVARAEPHLSTPARPRYVALLESELDNVRQSLAWTRDGAPEVHMRIVGMLHWFWFATGQWPEARQWLRGALTVAGAERRTHERAALLFSAGSIASMQARGESARVHLLEAESIAEETGDVRLLAFVRLYLAMAYVQISPEDVDRPLMLAHEALLQLNDLYGLRLSYLLQASAAVGRGDLARAIERAEEGVRVARVFGLDRELAIGLQQLAYMVSGQGDGCRARTLLREALEALRRDPQLFFVARSLEMMATSILADDPPTAIVVDAARLYGAADAIRELIGATMWRMDRERHEPRIARATQRIGGDAFAAARAEGRELTPDAAIEHALAVASRAGDAGVIDTMTQTGEFEVLRGADAIEPPSGALVVNALGPLEVIVDGVPVAPKRWGYAKARELLLLLLVHRDGRTREQIGAALWPESSSARVRNSVHVALHHLRRALGRSEWVRFDGERYRVTAIDGARIVFDAGEFEETVTAAMRSARRGTIDVDALRAAVGRYRGSFMEGEGAEDWHLEYHDRLARLHADALQRLGDAQLAARHNDEAAELFERLIRQETLDEHAYRSLMTARARGGDRAGALREYRRLEAILHREMDAAPQRESAALFQRIQRGEPI